MENLEDRRREEGRREVNNKMKKHKQRNRSRKGPACILLAAVRLGNQSNKPVPES